jgi:anti-sigma factor RsiW
MTEHITETEREEFEQLLPWYLNGTLGDAERARFEAALPHDAQLQNALRAAKEDREAVLDLADTIGAPSPQVLDRIMASTEGSGAAQRPVFETLVATAKQLLASLSPPALASAIAAVGLLIAVEAAAIGWLAWKGSTADGPILASQDERGEPTLSFLVKFSESARLSDVSQLLGDMGLVIIDGPTADNLYTVALFAPEGETVDGAELLKMLAAKSDIVVFAAPMPKKEE